MLIKECNATATFITDYSVHQVSASQLGYRFKLTENGVGQNPESMLDHDNVLKLKINHYIAIKLKINHDIMLLRSITTLP